MSLLRKKLQALSCLNLLAALAVAVLVASCAVDGYDDESFTHPTGIQLESPSADNITVTPNADGTQMTVTWPVVYGAGGYLVSLVNEADPSNPVVKDSVVDGCSVVLPRVEDQLYSFSIQTMANEELNNTAATTTTTKEISTFSPTYATIPDGTDLTAYFNEHPLNDEMDATDKPFDLQPGGHYTMSGNVNLYGNRATFRSTNEANPATITISGKSSIITKAGLTLKNINFECADETAPLILLDPNPSSEMLDKVAVGKGYYYITDPVRLVNVNVNGLANEVLNNNKVGYVISNLIIDNCVFHFNTGADMSSATYFNMYNNGAGINQFTATNSTFYNTSSNSMKYFIRYNNSTGPDRTGYSAAGVNFTQCTFYNIVPQNQICNYDRMRRGGSAVTWTLTKNIFYNTGGTQLVRRFIGGGSWSDDTNKSFNMNTYVANGTDNWTMPDAADASTWTGEAQYDQSGTILSGDPGFKDAANGDFTISGSKQVANKTGDPRWIK